MRFDMKLFSPARKNKDKKSVRKKDLQGNINLGNEAGPRGRKGAGCQAAARGEADG